MIFNELYKAAEAAGLSPEHLKALQELADQRADYLTRLGGPFFADTWAVLHVSNTTFMELGSGIAADEVQYVTGKIGEEILDLIEYSSDTSFSDIIACNCKIFLGLIDRDGNVLDKDGNIIAQDEGDDET